MPSNNRYQQLVSQSSTTNLLPKPLFIDDICANGTPEPQLKIGDQIVWFSDNGPEYGSVKWLGKLPDVGPEWIAGVDFVNPIGSGTGTYNDYRLFQTKLNHASLVPIIGLIRATDFQDNIAPPLRPKRTKKIDSNKCQNETSTMHNLKESSSDKNNAHYNSITNISNNLSELRLINMDDENDKSYNQNYSEKINSQSGSNFKLYSNQPKSITQKKENSFDDNFEPMQSSSSKPQHNGSLVVNIKTPEQNNLNDDLFEIGSVVEVEISSTFYHGVIRWLGFLKLDPGYKIDLIRKSNKHFKNVVAGIELEEEIDGLTDGTLNGRRYFICPKNKAYFVQLHECSKDSRFTNSTSRKNVTLLNTKQDSSLFGSIDCPTVLGDVPPLNSNDLTRLCGKNRGIQGHHNSCYLDATLFAMFAFSSIFESLLNRPKRPNDIPEYTQVQRILKEEIVNPLRSNLYVRADRVMHLRQLLEKISSMRGLTSEEKDPEELINLLLNEILKTDPFLKLSSGLESFFYQLFIEKDENLQLPNVQQLFDQSFLASDIKLREVPSCLMIQMPRFGRDFKMYSKIIPSLYLDITNVLDNSPRQCIICGVLAEYECKECFGELCEGLDSIAFCGMCKATIHTNEKRMMHVTTKLNIPAEFVMLQDHTNIPRVLMELFAVLCIETSHYVSFVKCGTEPDSPWCFFDSMADRKGEQNGYNIPEVIAFSDLKWWLSEEGHNFLLNNKDEKLIPQLPRRLISDAYICFYSSDVLHYR